jgi:hypothetical protein
VGTAVDEEVMAIKKFPIYHLSSKQPQSLKNRTKELRELRKQLHIF